MNVVVFVIELMKSNCDEEACRRSFKVLHQMNARGTPRLVVKAFEEEISVEILRVWLKLDEDKLGGIRIS